MPAQRRAVQRAGARERRLHIPERRVAPAQSVKRALGAVVCRPRRGIQLRAAERQARPWRGWQQRVHRAAALQQRDDRLGVSTGGEVGGADAADSDGTVAHGRGERGEVACGDRLS
tara:strand:+ start:687 stop:1034 length:348 start_codon:yes stop_codon:yes gene_type:complete